MAGLLESARAASRRKLSHHKPKLRETVQIHILWVLEISIQIDCAPAERFPKVIMNNELTEDEILEGEVKMEKAFRRNGLISSIPEVMMNSAA
ncbi:hypothetical protein ANN_02388 [Periplaneta americana]|uniref:Uncharacterized protein n=1 Tax=Periplaneta americana TaxID=6978 RepID=A0ABQ8TX89_PERAM|nr:hypothetical protein ANN_02388 [Periplaneta americana]